jgi:metallophosphoesterase (TIGR00282 family)
LFLGDIFSRTGRELVRDELPGVLLEEGVDLALANAENASGGRGLSKENARELLSCGLSAVSGGNHTFQQGGTEDLLDSEPRVLRPCNYPEPCPGRGWTLLETKGGVKVAFGNLMGRVFMQSTMDCPFKGADRMLSEMRGAGAAVTVIDFHAEATAEKKALAFYLDGRAGALLGTHTHVQTADCQILPGGTAYITDAGMTGAQHSVIGMEKGEVVKSFIDGRRHKFEPSKAGGSMNGVILDFDDSGRAKSIKPFSRPDVFRTSV